jgi:hypothetical protein
MNAARCRRAGASTVSPTLGAQLLELLQAGFEVGALGASSVRRSFVALVLLLWRAD